MHHSKNKFLLLVLIFVCVLQVACSSDEATTKSTELASTNLISGQPQNIPIIGMVTMVDIGAHSCIPCKMMTPIIEELSSEYAGRAAIAFIDVWVHPDEAQKYGIHTIPTQIFYDAEGKETYRHEGFLDKDSIVAMFAKLGVQ